MTKPQIWVTAFLFLFIVLFLLGRFTEKKEVERDFSQMNPMSTVQESNEETTGKDLVQLWGCTNCHGVDLKGTNMAPALEGLKKYWTRDNLINYLRNPNSYMDSERFKDYQEKYPNVIMPPYNNKDVKELGKVVDFLLAQ